MRTVIILISFVLIISSCKDSEVEECVITDSPLILEIPPHFPPVDFPEDNELSVKRVELGRKLFYDTRLSGDNSISCGSCHDLALAFTDGLTLSEGIENRVGMRNAPTLGNVAYQERLFGEGGVPNLEIQVLAPIGNEDEFDHDVNIIEADLLADSDLNSLANLAYGRDIDIYVVTRAISAFERTFITGNSKYDQHINETYTLSDQEAAGLDLFFNQLSCSECHSGHNFTDGDFHNIGLYETYEDEGRFRITNEDQDRGKFKTPSIRNIALTAPYMHNGSISSLDEVVEHFNSGGIGHQNQSDLIVPLNLSVQEKSDLIAFLHTLTDEEFVNNPAFKPL